MGTPKTILLTTFALGLGAAAGAAWMVWGGIYDVSATGPHTQPVYSLLETAMRQSVRLRARGIEPPALGAPAQVLRGAACYRDKCVQCHGAPGVAQGDIGKSMQPLPGPLVDARHRWNARELYWLTKNGIKMSGMPAWEYRLSDADLWALVAFLERLPDMTPQQYADASASASASGNVSGNGNGNPGAGAGPVAPMMPSAEGAPAAPACGPGPRAGDGTGGAAAPQDSVRRGQRALAQYACNACHTIPGTTGSYPNVGPPLAGMARRAMIGGKLANTPANMVRWLRHTREVDPLTAMPELGVTEEDARDIAAYLATLD